MLQLHHCTDLDPSRHPQRYHRPSGEILTEASTHTTSQQETQPILPRSFLGRLMLPMIEKRRTLAGVMSWIGLGILVAFILIAVLAPVIAPYPAQGPYAQFLTPPNQAPSINHWMGTDNLGQDVFSRVLWGAQTSLEVMAIGVVLALAVGFPVGLYSGYVGGSIDKAILLVMDSVYAFPGLLLAALVAAMLVKGAFNIGIAIPVIYAALIYRAHSQQTVPV